VRFHSIRSAFTARIIVLTREAGDL